MNHPDRAPLVVSARWAQLAILTFVFGFGVLGYLAIATYRGQPPAPARILGPGGETLVTAAEIRDGQHVFQQRGLMQHGSLFGHGAYLGPDFTAQSLHRLAGAMLVFHGESPGGPPLPEARARVREELKANRYDPASGTLTFTAAQVRGFEELVAFYASYFAPVAQQQGLARPAIPDRSEVRRLTAYFAWSAWVAAAARPGHAYSYTNNWPPEPLAGNEPTADALLWSSLSIVALLGGLGLVMFAFGRWRQLGWHGAGGDEPGGPVTFRPPEQVGLTPSQRAVAWYFLVVAGLFLAQGLLGGLNAHYHAEPAGFFGVDVAWLLPYNVSRMWHLQLALFFVSASFLAMGIFLAPLIAGHEPRHQDKLALALFGAVVLVVVGSLAGEWASVADVITRRGPWFWIGSQGWEYLDLGRLWQLLLLGGMVLWVVILVRGLRRALPAHHPGNLPWLFVYSAFSIPLFYAAGVVFWKNDSFAVIDFWRFWVVHLWVEDFLELFTTIMVATIFVQLGVVRAKIATTVVYLDIILYSVGGVIGTMHHLYFSGTPAQHMALGAFFSAMEVIPLVLLTYEAWRFMQLGGSANGGGAAVPVAAPAGAPAVAGGRPFPHRWAVMFLIAVGFWNFLGAGIFGFLINLPIVSYWEIGTQFTANHGHGAMMGVYGMLALGFFMFVARYFIPPDRNSERAMKLSFWSLNLGLGWMMFVNLGPIGTLQLYDAVTNGYWHAREAEFFGQFSVRSLEWLRLPGDLLFIAGGILPVVYLAGRMWQNRRRTGAPASSMAAGALVDPHGER